MDAIDVLRTVAAFKDLPPGDLALVHAAGRTRAVQRGGVLVEEGAPSDALFVVLSGRFSVSLAGRPEPIAEIAVGETIGEIGFFVRTPRMATVRAVRDSAVLAFDRDAFDALVARSPRLYEMVLASLARRLGDTSRRMPGTPATTPTPARTVAVIPGGEAPLPPGFLDRLAAVFGRGPRALVLTSSCLPRLAGDGGTDGHDLSHALDAVERGNDLVVYVADAGDTEWTRKAVRQADELLVAVTGPPGQPLSAVERFAFGLHDPVRRRLCIVHPRRTGAVAGTAAWLRERPVAMHHHIAEDDDADLWALRRFVTGRATGFVAGGGGGFGPAHLGIQAALAERGIVFDMFGGTSVGAAMTAGFAMLADAETLDRGVHAIFVEGRGLRRPTLPRYALLDHKAFDRGLRAQYGDAAVEDMWRPWFAVATDLSAGVPHVIRTGPVWRAVRSSGAIPGVLPPTFTPDGRMLVDGAILDNLPISTMRRLKAGPNLLVSFGIPEIERFEVDYDAIPGRRALLARLLNPFSRKTLPRIPGPASVLGRCLMANSRFDRAALTPGDLLLEPPPFPGSSFLDFGQHSRVMHAARDWARARFDALERDGDPAFAALRAAAAPPVAG